MVDKEKRQQILSEAIQAFAANPRYQFLRTLQVGRFLSPDEEGIGVVSELTFEKLIEIGSAKIAKLRWLNEPQESRLIALLSALTDDIATPDPLEKLITPPPRPSPLSANYAPEEEEGLSSAEVENRLREILLKLSSHPQFTLVAHKPLSAFWSDDWPRAPFEEAMSLEQLCGMDLAVLWKKRTTTSRRIDRMARAAEVALNQLTADISTTKEQGISVIQDEIQSIPERRKLSVVPQQPRSISRSILEISASRHRWMEEASELPLLERVGIRKFLEVCLQPDVKNDGIGSIIRTVIDTISLSEFISILAPGWHIDNATPAIRLFGELPEVQANSTSIRLVLQGPGVHISALRKLSLILESEPEVGELALIAVVKMLGAAEVSIKGEVCNKVYSLNPGLVETVLAGISVFDKKEPVKTISQYLPNLDQHLASWLKNKIESSRPISGAKKGKKLPRLDKNS